MSFVTTQPEALTAAASTLQTIGSGMAAQNAAAAAPTTGIVPAAADEVSALQAAQFGAYGTWYQQVSGHATAIHQMLVNTLGTSAGSYGQTEAANQAATSSASLSGLGGGLTGSGTSGSGLSGALSAAPAAAAAADPPAFSSSTGALLGTPFLWEQNVGSAASDFIALGQGQFLPQAVSWTPPPGFDASAPFPFGFPNDLGGAAAVGPTGSAGFGLTPVLADAGQASSVGGLSVPPSWAAAGTPAVSPAPTTLAGAGWTSAAPQSAPVTAMPAGVPSVASAGRGGVGFGAPRYGVKPTVMPKPTVV
ncbi:MAG: PE domain-containing protein [Mycobacterium sp.]|nr:PE domain-containing protein [Mycobacterium sp.]